MDVGGFLESTPVEINWKIEAWNDARRAEAQRDYRFILTLLNGRNKPDAFPSFQRFYPENDPETDRPRIEKHVAKAMETARALGHI